jgi:hypothetical protein
MPEAVAFEYLYRDGDNYKNYGRVVFANPEGVPPEEVERRLRAAFSEEDFFIAGQVRIPEVFLWDPDADYDPDDPETWPADLGPGRYVITEADHCWHEFSRVYATDEPPDDAHGRTVAEFVREVEAAAREGWRVFSPADRAKAKK